MTETYKFIDLIKSLLVCACLLATLCSTCRQELANDKLQAEISALRAVSDDVREAVYRTEDDE